MNFHNDDSSVKTWKDPDCGLEQRQQTFDFIELWRIRAMLGRWFLKELFQKEAEIKEIVRQREGGDIQHGRRCLPLSRRRFHETDLAECRASATCDVENGDGEDWHLQAACGGAGTVADAKSRWRSASRPCCSWRT